MAIGRITGPMLFSNLDRQGANLAFDSNLVYLDVNNRRVGISNSNPQYTLDVTGNVQLGNIVVYNNSISSTTGKIDLGSVSSITLTGGSPDQIIYTDGNGNLAFGSMALLAGLEGFTANNIIVGTVAQSHNGFGTSALTTGMDVATAINTLDNIIGNITNVKGNVITTGNLFLSGVTGYTTANNVLITDGTGNTSFVNATTLPAIVSINSNVSVVNANITSANLAISSINSNISAINANIIAANLAISSTNSNVSAINSALTAVNVAISAVGGNVTSLTGNTITLGANTVASLTSNAVTLTQTTKVTDAIAQLNYVLGKLVPSSPPAFPSGTTLTINSVTSYGRMTTMTQVDNAGTSRSVSSGTTLANVLRSGSYTTNTFSNMGEGSSGTLTVYLNNVAAGANTLVGGGGAKITSNLVITNNQDYHVVQSSVAAGFWYSFSCYATGTVTNGGYHNANISYTGGPGTSTNTATWYYDSSNPGTPTFSNVQALSSGNLLVNAVSYSSTIPHFNSSTIFRLKGNVSKLSGDMYYSSDTFMTGSAGGAFQAPTNITYTQAGVTTPLVQNLYVSSGSAYFETNVNIIASGFGSSSTGPSLTAYNSYLTGSQTYTPTGLTILYKNSTSTNIEETSIPVTSVGTGSGNGSRIANPGSADNPSFTGNEATFNSQTSPLQTYDATNVGSSGQGIIKFDQTNYSTGYLPAGPNLSGQGASQYFTFKFTRTTVSKFDIVYSGTIAGLWVALPGSTIMTTASPTNGWLDMSTAYAGSGVPGTGTGGNGSAGCSTGGVAVLNSAQSNKSVTSTFGTVQSGSSGSNTGDIYVRIKLISGQSLTALSIVTATH